MKGMLIWCRKKIVSRSWSSVSVREEGSTLTFCTRTFSRGQAAYVSYQGLRIRPSEVFSGCSATGRVG